MAKKLAEEAIEVVIDAVHGDSEAVIRESADLLYNLTVLWASAGVRPEDVWREMARREDMLGIAEKLPKSPLKLPKAAALPVASGAKVRFYTNTQTDANNQKFLEHELNLSAKSMTDIADHAWPSSAGHVPRVMKENGKWRGIVNEKILDAPAALRHY